MGTKSCKVEDRYFKLEWHGMISYRCLPSFFILSFLLTTNAQSEKLRAESPSHEIIQARDGFFYEGHRRFRFSGSNNYFLTYEKPDLVLDILDNMKSAGIRVLRTWAFIDIGSLDGNIESVDSDVVKNGAYFQYWNASLQAPALNGGNKGLEKLDWLIYEAGKRDIRLILTLTNNWPDIGGIPQYLAWRGSQYHDDFFFDETIKSWYKTYITSLINRSNRYTGITYKHDPAIFAWELVNEVRCYGKTRPTSKRCSSATITDWVDEMSTYVKSIDSRHLLTVGDEGFFHRSSSDWAYNGSTGVDAEALARLSNVDYVSFHIYPETWRKDEAWTMRWIKDHLDLSKTVGKPVVIGEYGIKNRQKRDRIYRDWHNLFQWENGDGSIVWMLNGEYANGISHWDHDGYSIYCPSETCVVLKEHSSLMNGW